MNCIGSRLVLNTYNADVNVGGFNGQTTYYNINFKNILGDDYELEADYNLILNNVTINSFTLGASRRCGTFRLYCGAMLFNNNYNSENCGIFLSTAQSGGPLSTSYNLVMYETFKLTSEIGNIKVDQCNQLSSTPFTGTAHSGVMWFFTIKRIKYYLPTIINTNDKTNMLVLSSYVADVDTNNVILQWNNINFKNLLGDNYELNATYNLVLMNISIGNTSVTSANRAGYLRFESNSLEVKYANANNWVIPFGFTNVQPNAVTFRCSSDCTFILTSETGYIQIDHYIHHLNRIDSTVALPDKILYFCIYKL
jgi:hypothetical protein